MSSKLYICPNCNQLVEQLGCEEKEFTCCGEKMKEVIANTVEASVEKHIPDIKVDGNRLEVSVGVVPHPQSEEHFVSYIFVRCGNISQRKSLSFKDEAKAVFFGEWSGKIEVEAYCNVHGSWLSTIIV